jgi:pentatricopeptide repeat protein
MQAEGLRPSTACLTSAISACMHGGQPARAEQLFERMYAICKPDASTFNCLVCVYCRLGKHQQAANVLEVMLRGGQHVDLTTFDAAIDACWATGVVPLQKYALELYERARQQGLFQGLITEQVRRLMRWCCVPVCVLSACGWLAAAACAVAGKTM